ncbi:3-hydroxybutyrate dehydrogenase [Parapedobacter defluvii]|nr:3-hydroxybutyrate dehydrogenase [Parapedobacter defluvii]
MNNRVVLITGSAGGIGLEIAKAMAENGYTVCLTDLNGAAVTLQANLLVEQGHLAIGIGCDVTDENQLKSAIQHVVAAYGRLDVLINNAGVQYVSMIEDFPSERFEQLVKIMLTAPFYSIKHAFPIMKAQRFGRIINMASINGLVGFVGKAAYNSAKHGVIGLTKVAALEGALHGITVIALCPGYVDTDLVRNQLGDIAKQRNIEVEHVLEEVIYPLVPQRRLLDVCEIADYVIFLASDRAKGITGQAVVIDGGYTAQ